MTVVLAHAGVVVRLAAVATGAHSPGVGGQLEFGGGQVLVAARAKVDISAHTGGVLGYFDETGSLRVEGGSLDILEEERGYTLAETIQVGFFDSAHE